MVVQGIKTLYCNRPLIKGTMFAKLAILVCLLVATSAEVRPHLGYGNQNANQSASPINSRIVGGTKANPHEFPHIVSLQNRNKHFCGGSIINKNWVITAGHCVNEGDTIVIKAGKYLVSTAEKSEQTIKVVKIIVHEDFGGDVEPDDIALLKLQKPLVFNKYVRPIALPKKYSEVEGDVIITGWGSTQPTGSGTPRKLRKATLPIIDLYTCKKAFAALSDEPAPLEDSNICTGPLSGGLSPCSGDSGGPLFTHGRGKSEIIGIVSWGYYPCGTKGAPAVFTKVSYYIDWIEKVMAKN